VKRRESIWGAAAAGGLAALAARPLRSAAAQASAAAPARGPDPESREAFRDLLGLVTEAERRTLSAEWGVRIVVAHRDPDVANWLETEGRPFGTIFWRFLQPEETPERPHTEVVPITSLARGG
jgi:hypothetical protein